MTGQLEDVSHRIEAYLENAADPDAVTVGLHRLVEAGADPRPHLESWMKLIDASPAAVETLVTRPHLVRELPETGGAYERDRFERELAEALQNLPDRQSRLNHLRAVRVAETLRIAWQDVVEGADLTVVTRRISDLAEILLEFALAEIQRDLALQFGRPWHESEPVGLAAIAMGKLGGAELNYSSDIDLIFLYGKDGSTDGGAGGRRITNRDYFHRLSERVTHELNAVTEHGRLYRVDLRLRPEGSSGSLARSLASSIAYYRTMGETWERQAFLKARPVAGDRTIGREFVESVRSWAYGRGLSFEEIATLKRIKERMEQVTAHRGEERSEVKLGYGGIRDVEYVVQFLQLLHGARNPELRHHNSLTALRLLEKHGAILPEERNRLDDAYRFLRTVEHRLQLVQGAPVHRIPSKPAELRALGRRVGFRGAASFMKAYEDKAEAVRTLLDRHFRKLFGARDEAQVSETNLLLEHDRDPNALARVLEAHGFRDASGSIWLLTEMEREASPWLSGSARTPKLFADLFPRLLDAIAGTPDADAALRRLERITARVGARGTLYQAMIADERLLHVLVTLAANSRFLTGILARAPGVLDELVDLLATDPELGLASFEDIPTATVPTTDDPARILSDYKNLETLRIGLRDLNGTATVRELGADLSRLAEIVVRLAFERARGEVGTSGADLVVFGLGKLGGRELLYGSDLDLVFFCRDDAERGAAAAVAQRLRELLATPTAHGKLYEVDLRLRPGGTGGPLVTTPTGFRDYFNRGLGQCWERMAYTRTRAVAGPPTLCEEIQREIEETIYTPGFLASDARAMTAMREKLATARPESLKRARSGGVMDLEFLAQMYVLRRGRDDTQLREGNVGRVLDLLQERALLQPQRAADLLAAYQFLVALESRIRIVADIHEDRLPEDAEALHTLARRLGYVDTGTAKAEETLREEYEYHRGVAARAFASAVKALGG